MRCYNCNKKYCLLKKFDNKLTFCYVGRLTKNKGFELLLDSIGKLKQTNWIEKLHCVGDGPLKNEYLSLSESLCVPICFHGLLDREELNKIYQDSHFIILPSQSEGFPKVLAEAASYGCVPIVSNLSSISQYINNNISGVLIDDLTQSNIKSVLSKLSNKRENLMSMAFSALKWVSLFTYSRYVFRIEKEIINE